MKIQILPRYITGWPAKVAAAVLSFSLLAPSVYAAEQPAGQASEQSAGQAAELNAESAAGFLDSFFASDATKPLYVGASVAIVKDGEVIAQKGYGYADQEKQTPVDPASTVFRIASVSKTFTAVAAMQLVEQGKIDLQDDFREYAPGLTFDNPFDKPVTIEHLLTHTTGFEIQDPKPTDMHTDFSKYVSIEDYVKENMPPVVREPGSSYMYDNFASLVLGLVVQNASGMPFEEYMEQHVFEPLGMESSGYLQEGLLKDNLATGYDAAGNKVEPYAVTPTIMPHGGMLSTASDVTKFMTAFLNGGANGSDRILEENTVSEMEEYRSYAHPLLPDTTYGFEAPFQLPGAGSSSEIITKAGDLTDTSSYLFLIPEQNTGVFLTYTKQSALRNLFYSQFISTFFPEYAAPDELPDYSPQPAEELERFTGYYSDLRLHALVSSVQTGEGELTISDAFLGPRTLHQVDDNLFIDDLTGQFTAFKLNEDGEAVYLKEPYLNPLGYGKKGTEPNGFADVAEDHPYAEYIYMLQSLGYYPNDAEEKFQPERPVTRAEFVQHTLEASMMKGSESTDYAFTDLEGHPAAAFVQQAYELGMVLGDGKGKFKPDQPIKRQEAAVMLWRLYSLTYDPELFKDVKLTGHTDEWAVPAVQMMVALGIHGPEVQTGEDGAADYRSKQQLSRQEEAAVLFALLTQPTDQIVAGLQEQQPPADETDAADAADPADAADTDDATDAADPADAADAADADDATDAADPADAADADDATDAADPADEADAA